MHKGKIQIKDNVLKYISRKIEIFYKMKTDKVPPPSFCLVLEMG